MFAVPFDKSGRNATAQKNWAVRFVSKVSI